MQTSALLWNWINIVQQQLFSVLAWDTAAFQSQTVQNNDAGN